MSTAIQMPVGISEFPELIQGGYAFVDKTLLIEDLIEHGAKVTLITRPRRFGKTLNLSMLQHFFAVRTQFGRSTRKLFKGLAVARRPSIMAHQGQYPVILFSFKDIKSNSFEAFENDLRTRLPSLFGAYPELTDSPHLAESDVHTVNALMSGTANPSQMAHAFRFLSEVLSKHHGRQVVILLDEYDAPIHAAYTHGYYDRLIDFMRSLLGSALKDNPNLYKSVITGILRVSKESLFSDLNNIEVHTVLDQGYARHFGFTEAEVAGLLEATGLDTRQPALEGEIKSWYNGYRFGTQVIYNPWSIVNCLKQNGALKTHWVNTGGNFLLKSLMAQADADFKEGLQQLIEGRSIDEAIDPNLVFGNLAENSTALWSLLLFSGYLTALATRVTGTKAECELAIPNQEIRHLYEDIVHEWFTDSMNPAGYRRFLNSLVTGEMKKFEASLRSYLLESSSLFDAQGNHPEKFYHGLVLGLIAGLRDTHVVHSNRESGDGRYEVALFPKGKRKTALPGVIIEFKQVGRRAGLKAAAKAALKQISARRYQAELRQHPVGSILAIGLAFSGKDLAMAYRTSRVQVGGVKAKKKRTPRLAK